MKSVSIFASVFLMGMISANAQSTSGRASEPTDAEKLALLRSQVDQLNQRLDKMQAARNGEANVQTQVAGSAAIDYGVKLCPDGYYASGLQAWGSPGSTRYCIGCLTGVTLVCKKFP